MEMYLEIYTNLNWLVLQTSALAIKLLKHKAEILTMKLEARLLSNVTLCIYIHYTHFEGEVLHLGYYSTASIFFGKHFMTYFVIKATTISNISITSVISRK